VRRRKYGRHGSRVTVTHRPAISWAVRVAKIGCEKVRKGTKKYGPRTKKDERVRER